MRQLSFLPRKSLWQRFMSLLSYRQDLILPPPDRSTQRQGEIFDRQARLITRMEKQG